MKVVHVDRLKPYEGEPLQSWLKESVSGDALQVELGASGHIEQNPNVEEEIEVINEVPRPITPPIPAPRNIPVPAPRRNPPRIRKQPTRFT